MSFLLCSMQRLDGTPQIEAKEARPPLLEKAEEVRVWNRRGVENVTAGRVRTWFAMLNTERAVSQKRHTRVVAPKDSLGTHRQRCLGLSVRIPVSPNRTGTSGGRDPATPGEGRQRSVSRERSARNVTQQVKPGRDLGTMEVGAPPRWDSACAAAATSVRACTRA